MMMIVDCSKMKQSFAEMQSDLDKVGEGLGVQVKCQREEIFEKMHRI